MKKCKACQKEKPESKFAINQDIDEDCKRYLDNIYKQARAGGPKDIEWYKSVRGDPVKLKKLVDNYEKDP